MKKSILYILFLPLLILMLSKGYRYYRNHLAIPDVTIAGFIEMADGLGRQSVELIDILHKDIDVNFRKTRHNQLRDVPQRLHPIIRKHHRPLGRVVIFEETLSVPEHVLQKIFHDADTTCIRLAYSMFETSKISQEFVGKINRYFDAVIVPDAYHIETYQKSGVKRPIFVLPLGLDLSAFLQAPLKMTKNTPFVFGNFASCERRKNQLMLIKAFAKAFGNRNDVLLKIHARRAMDSELILLHEELRKLGHTNIELIIESVDKDQYLRNFQSIDCYVTFSKGEGFSIQPREAMALGIPVIASDNTAQSTICNTKFIKPVPSKIEEKAVYESLPKEDYGSFFNISLEDATNALLDVFEHYDHYLESSAASRQWAKNYQYSHLKPLYQTLIKPKRLTLGKDNVLTPESLTTNSDELYQKYLQLYPRLRP